MPSKMATAFHLIKCVGKVLFWNDNMLAILAQRLS